VLLRVVHSSKDYAGPTVGLLTPPYDAPMVPWTDNPYGYGEVMVVVVRSLADLGSLHWLSPLLRRSCGRPSVLWVLSAPPSPEVASALVWRAGVRSVRYVGWGDLDPAALRWVLTAPEGLLPSVGLRLRMLRPELSGETISSIEVLLGEGMNDPDGLHPFPR